MMGEIDMKKVQKIILMSVLSLILISLSQIASAKGFTFTPTPSSTDLATGENMTIDLKLSNIDAGDEGINTFQCNFKYDEDIFESVKVNSKNNWSITYNNNASSDKNGTMLAVIVKEGVKTDQEIGTITLRVKQDAKGKSGIITFTDVTTNDGKQSIIDTNKTINVSVTRTGSSGGNSGGNTSGGSSNGNYTGGSNNGITLNKNITGGSTQKVQSNNSSKLPSTGLNAIITTLVILSVIGAIIASCIAYKKYRKVK